MMQGQMAGPGGNLQPGQMLRSPPPVGAVIPGLQGASPRPGVGMIQSPRGPNDGSQMMGPGGGGGGGGGPGGQVGQMAGSTLGSMLGQPGANGGAGGQDPDGQQPPMMTPQDQLSKFVETL